MSSKTNTLIDNGYIINKFICKNGRINPNTNKIITKEEEIYLLSQFCNVTNIKESIYLIYHKLSDIPRCPICNEYLVFENNKYPKNCKKQSCISKQRAQTKLQKYGNANYNNRDKCNITKLQRYGNPNYNNVQKTLQTKLQRYGNKNYVNSEKALRTKLQRYGSKNYNNISAIKNTKLQRYGNETYRDIYKMQLTKLQKYGNKSYVNPEKAKITKLQKYGNTNYNNRINAIKTTIKRYGVENYVKTEQWKKHISDKIYQLQRKQKEYLTKKKNNSFHISKQENICFELLKQKFGDNNIIRQYKSEKYPYCCDFYIPSIDTYIEYQGTWTHGEHPFDKDSLDDLTILEKWKNKGTKYYCNAIKTWTYTDKLKREYAYKNNLNYIEFWSLKDVEKFINKNNGE